MKAMFTWSPGDRLAWSGSAVAPPAAGCALAGQCRLVDLQRLLAADDAAVGGNLGRPRSVRTTSPATSCPRRRPRATTPPRRTRAEAFEHRLQRVHRASSASPSWRSPTTAFTIPASTTSSDRGAPLRRSRRHTTAAPTVGSAACRCGIGRGSASSRAWPLPRGARCWRLCNWATRSALRPTAGSTTSRSVTSVDASEYHCVPTAWWSRRSSSGCLCVRHDQSPTVRGELAVSLAAVTPTGRSGRAMPSCLLAVRLSPDPPIWDRC